ncbi:MAG: HD domain-containing protein [Ruminococcaceae bacterium]|nr:HD domain-containing protein [Oscillospiraceae bacterium]
MTEKKFYDFAVRPSNPKWEQANMREVPLYKRNNEVRSEFLRDYTRVLHCSAFRRLKHKTQVFFSPQNDHVCTRIEHVLHVESIALTIACALGLNEELTKAIAISHDLGHSPFGHKGEKTLDKLLKKDVGERFWHERNGLFFVDRIELLEDEDRNKRNLDLSYAVRDGIISHCGESDDRGVKPRDEAIDLYVYDAPNKFAPFTYEACVVKLADKISYLGRDIEDARILGVLTDRKIDELETILRPYLGQNSNNTVIINYLINDLCLNSTPDDGIRFSDETNELVKLIKDFNNENIYQTPRVKRADSYFDLVLTQIYEVLRECFDKGRTHDRLLSLQKLYPEMIGNFLSWIVPYGKRMGTLRHKNEPVYDISDEKDYCRAIIHYISGMTDKYAIDTYNNAISF